MIKWFGIVTTALALSSALAAMALAQERTDPGIPPDPPSGSTEGWQVLGIPGLPPGTVLGDIHASAEGTVHVWAYQPPWVNGAGVVEGGEGEGERLPNTPWLPRVGTSILYRLDGSLWTVALRAPGEMAVALYGTEGGRMFASTTNVLGEAQVYSFDGSTWNRELLPVPVRGRLHTFAGVPGDLYLRVDGTILHHDGNALAVVYQLPAVEKPARGLVYLGADCLFVMGMQGHHMLHQGEWSEAPADFPFDAVQDAWATRDTDGFLHLFALGSDAASCGLKLWSFRELDLDTHAGQWEPMFGDPIGGGVPGTGLGLHLWGVTGNDVYATGVVNGEGRMLRYDGTGWIKLAPPAAFGTIHGVWGTPNGVVWFSTEGGNIIRYQRANRAPEIAAARPSVDRLWPGDLGWVPLHLQGIVDPDGDAMTIEITRITQDEPLVTDGHASACPDAMVTANLIHLRAEHQANGDGRTYAIEFTATDRLGAMSRGHVYVFAPHYAQAPVDPDPTTFDAMGDCPVGIAGALQAQAVRGSLEVRYGLEQAGPIHLAVYDVSGRMRAVIAEGMQAQGAQEAHWNMDRLEPGVYFVKLRTRHGPALVQRVIAMR